MASLSYETALATFRVIDQYVAADFDTLGIRPEDFSLTSSYQPWVRQDLARCMRTLNALTFGTLEVMGMPKIVVPAEYQAAIIAGFVAPPNRMAACIWLSQERQTGAGALESSARNQTTSQLDPASADQLFALVVSLSESDIASDVRQNFRRRVGLAVEKAQELN